jgi:hypothetical protein
MLFVDYLVALLIISLIAAAFLFMIFPYCINRMINRIEDIASVNISDEYDDHQRRLKLQGRLIWTFAITAVVTLIATSGYNAFLHTHQ